jgi:hypothetical protein
MDARNADHACLIDGVMSPQEQALDDRLYAWSLLYGEEGGWMNILVYGEGFRHLDIRLYYMDNMVDGFTPEGDPAVSSYGSTGYRVKDFQRIQEGKFLVLRTHAFALDPGFIKGDEACYVDLVQHPLEISVGESWDVATAPP